MLVSYTKVNQFQTTRSIIANICLKFCTFSFQQTPLHVAANNGHDYTVKCLVQKGADINIKDKKGVNEKLYL